MVQVVVLVHLSRSGSTLLSRLLDELDEVGVTIEGVIPDGMTVPWAEIADPPALETALDSLFAEHKFRHWGVDRAGLKRRLAGGGFPIGFQAWLSAILAAYFEARPKLKAHVYKRDAWAGHLEEIRRRAPGVKVLAIIRDPRGIYACQLRRGSTPGPTSFARAYNRFVRSLRRFEGQPWLHVVRYEALVAEPEAEIARVAAFVGANAERRHASDYAGQIPAPQRHLHDRLSGAVDLEIADEWRTQLDPLSLMCIEYLCQETMTLEGYAPVRQRPGPLAVSTAIWWFRLRRPLRYLGRLTGLKGPAEARAAWRRALRSVVGAAPSRVDGKPGVDPPSQAA